MRGGQIAEGSTLVKTGHLHAFVLVTEMAQTVKGVVMVILGKQNFITLYRWKHGRSVSITLRAWQNLFFQQTASATPYMRCGRFVKSTVR